MIDRGVGQLILLQRPRDFTLRALNSQRLPFPEPGRNLKLPAPPIMTAPQKPTRVTAGKADRLKAKSHTAPSGASEAHSEAIAMAKPQVFLSHSSKDHTVLARLVGFLEQRTHGVIQFFLSGRDVRPGIAWEPAVLDELAKSTLVFTFFSDEALQSVWVLFETGFARGRGITVVPIGLPDMDVNAIPNPVGSIHGINLHSPDDVRRLLELLNSELDHAHPTAVDDDEFANIIQGEVPAAPAAAPVSGKYRVFTKAGDAEVSHEVIDVTMDGSGMTVTSQWWKSRGALVNGRFVGGFHHFGLTSPDHVGVHEFKWNGHEFQGSAQVDSNKWRPQIIIWRPLKEE